MTTQGRGTCSRRGRVLRSAFQGNARRSLDANAGAGCSDTGITGFLSRLIGPRSNRIDCRVPLAGRMAPKGESSHAFGANEAINPCRFGLSEILSGHPAMIDREIVVTFLGFQRGVDPPPKANAPCGPNYRSGSNGRRLTQLVDQNPGAPHSEPLTVLPTPRHG
jgi:hypothetical protein